jgi:hypothetical protein
MNRRIILIAVILIVTSLILYITYSYLEPVIVARILPAPTSIFNGPLNLEIINNLKATQSNGEINREQAIGLAELYCASANSVSKTNPSNVITYHLTYKEAARRIIKGQDYVSLDPSTPVWPVSINGTWEHEPPSIGTPSPPLIFTRCRVIINAKTGEWTGLMN